MEPAGKVEIMQVLAKHALWVHVKPNGQPSQCGCGRVFKLGESFVAHVADAILEEAAKELEQ